ncbi:MAG: hypothetical protein ACJAY8_000951 [Sphingobacteriales bacterium]
MPSKHTAMDNKKIQSLTSQLETGNEVEFNAALTVAQKSPNPAFIEPLIVRLSAEELNSPVYDTVYKTLGEIKMSAALPLFIKWLGQKEHSNIHQALLFFIWNSSLDASDNLPEITKVGLEGDFLTSFEALTVLENLEGPFEEEFILEALLTCKTYLSNNEPERNERQNIIEAIVRRLHELEGQIQD